MYLFIYLFINFSYLKIYYLESWMSDDYYFYFFCKIQVL
jgi:hypothetical protein